MPFPWALAFRAIPWTEVIAAAPGVARNAQRLWKQASGGAHGEELTAELGDGTRDERLHRLEMEIMRLDDQATRQTELITRLAEQNTTLVQAVEVLRLRMRLLYYVSGALGVGLVIAFIALS